MNILQKSMIPEKQFVNQLSTRFRMRAVKIPMMPKGVEHMLMAEPTINPGCEDSNDAERR